MNVCKKCGEEFDPTTVVSGKRVYRYKRQTCFECQPFQPHSLKNKDGKRCCRMCKEYKAPSSFTVNSKQGYLDSYCRICARKRQSIPRQKFKLECIAYKGGRCIDCGYNRCPAALEFHHRDKKKKEFSLRDVHATSLTEKIKKELDKCDLLCSNCHKEKHYNPVEL